MSETRRCPDGGYCGGRGCELACLRFACSGPLSGVYPGDRWPRAVRRRQAALAYEDARRALNQNGIDEAARGINRETPEYHMLNDAVIRTERGVRWWTRWAIDRRVCAEQNYFARVPAGEWHPVAWSADHLAWWLADHRIWPGWWESRRAERWQG